MFNCVYCRTICWKYKDNRSKMGLFDVPNLIISCSVLLFILGLVNAIVNFYMIAITENSISSVWYVGLIAMMASLRGFYLPTLQSYRLLGLFALISAVIAIAGSAVAGIQYSF